MPDLKKHPEFWVAVVLAVIAGVLAFSWDGKWLIPLGAERLADTKLLDAERLRLEWVKFLAYLAAGMLLVLQIRISNRRATALEDTVRVGREGIIAERFKNAIGHLGGVSSSVRIGGIHTLYNIAKARESRPEYARAVLEILAAHLREKSKVRGCDEEVKTIVRMLFPSLDDEEIFKGKDSKYALEDINLSGANLQRAQLENRAFYRVDFDEANLTGANLKDTLLYNASMERAILDRADLRGAELRRCFLGSAYCRHTNFSNASIDRDSECLFIGTDLSYADFRGAAVDPTDLMEANTLYGAKLDDDVLEEIRAKKPELLAPPSDS